MQLSNRPQQLACCLQRVCIVRLRPSITPTLPAQIGYPNCCVIAAAAQTRCAVIWNSKRSFIARHKQNFHVSIFIQWLLDWGLFKVDDFSLKPSSDRTVLTRVSRCFSADHLTNRVAPWASTSTPKVWVAPVRYEKQWASNHNDSPAKQVQVGKRWSAFPFSNSVHQIHKVLLERSDITQTCQIFLWMNKERPRPQLSKNMFHESLTDSEY